MTTALEGGEGSASRPGRSLPPEKTRYTLYRRLGGPQGRCVKSRPPPGFDPRTIHSVKCTLVQALRFCTGRTAHRGSRGIALLFHDHGTRRGWGVSVTPRPLFTPGERAGTNFTGSWVGPRAGLDRCGKSRPTEIRSPDRPARSQSLYRLSYRPTLLTVPYNKLRTRELCVAFLWVSFVSLSVYITEWTTSYRITLAIQSCRTQKMGNELEVNVN